MAFIRYLLIYIYIYINLFFLFLFLSRCEYLVENKKKPSQILPYFFCCLCHSAGEGIQKKESERERMKKRTDKYARSVGCKKIREKEKKNKKKTEKKIDVLFGVRCIHSVLFFFSRPSKALISQPTRRGMFAH